jgi:hypothetical protein
MRIKKHSSLFICMQCSKLLLLIKHDHMTTGTVVSCEKIAALIISKASQLTVPTKKVWIGEVSGML